MAEMRAKHLEFALRYIACLNATEAYRKTYPKNKNPDVDGPKLLGNPGIKAFIDEALAKRAEKLELTAERVLQELMRIGFVDIARAYGEDGKLLKFDTMPEDVRRAIAGVEVEDLWGGEGEDRRPIGDIRKVKFWSKPDALVALGKHLKLFTERVEATIEDNRDLTDDERAARIEAILERAAQRKAELSKKKVGKAVERG